MFINALHYIFFINDLNRFPLDKRGRDKKMNVSFDYFNGFENIVLVTNVIVFIDHQEQCTKR